MNNVLNTIIISITILAITGLVFVQSEKYLKQSAIQTCKQVATHTIKEDQWNTVTKPIDDEYQKCIQAKGY